MDQGNSRTSTLQWVPQHGTLTIMNKTQVVGIRSCLPDNSLLWEVFSVRDDASNPLSIYEILWSQT